MAIPMTDLPPHPVSVSVPISHSHPHLSHPPHSHSPSPELSTPPSPSAPSPTSSPSSTPPTHHNINDENNLDDIWGSPPPYHSGEEGNSPTTGPSSLSAYPSDIPRIRSIHSNAGYRDGIAAAREAAVQPGFDEGYLLGAALGIRAGRLVGSLEGILRGIRGKRLGRGVGRELAVEKGKASLVGLKAEMKRELALESLLGRQWIAEDGTWKWTVVDRGLAGGGGEEEEEEEEEEKGGDDAAQVTPLKSPTVLPDTDADTTTPTAAATTTTTTTTPRLQINKEEDPNDTTTNTSLFSIDVIAAAHPLLQKWEKTVTALLQAANVPEGPVGILAENNRP